MSSIKRFLTILILSPFLFHVGGVSAAQVKVVPELEQVQERKIATKELDKRAQILQAYLAKYNSPIQGYASDFIEAADAHGVDWKLVPAITGVESTFGRNIPGGHDPRFSSYNGWGWGVYGDQVLKFNSWREGIFTVTEGLKKDYIARGLTDPYSMNRRYAASPTWGVRVDYFMNDLAAFEKQYIKTEKALGKDKVVYNYFEAEAKAGELITLNY